MPDKMVKLLDDRHRADTGRCYPIEGFVDIPDLMQLYSLERPRAKGHVRFALVHPRQLEKEEEYLRRRQKAAMFCCIIRTCRSAGDRFYRRGGRRPGRSGDQDLPLPHGKDSPIVDSLIRASRLGKQVTALVELKGAL